MVTAAASRLIASTIDDDPSKAMWADNVTWQEGPYGGLSLWPDWWAGNHPGMYFGNNPGVPPEGRWVVRLSGSASWDQFTLPDTESKAMRRKVLMRADGSWHQSY